MTLKVVGQRKKRYDGLAHASGETTFVDDVHVPGMLMVKAYRSPVVKGKIRSIDISEAEDLPGVAGIITHQDVPVNAYGLRKDQPILAEKNICYQGEPIAAVAAADEPTALKAVGLIKADIEAEEHVFDPLEAMKPGAPEVRPGGNLFKFGDRDFQEIEMGDVEAGFEEADYIVEGEYFHPAAEHAPMEPQVSLAVPESDGRLTIHTVSQAISLNSDRIAGVLNLKPGGSQSDFQEKTGLRSIRYVGGTVGGGFGAKVDLHADPVTALLALKTGCPVKWRWTREEEMLYSTHSGAWYVRVRDGVRKDGRIVARQIRSIRDAGAHTRVNPFIINKHCFMATGPYDIPNVRIRGYCVFTNKAPAAAMRGFGVPPAAFATEVQMDKIAHKLGISPWEIRFINAVRNKDKTVTGRVLNSVYLVEAMQALARKAKVELPENLMKMTSAPREESA